MNPAAAELRACFCLGLALLLSACALDQVPDDDALASLDYGLLSWLPAEPIEHGILDLNRYRNL